MKQPLTLISHLLCPYVQRVAIALTEKRVPHERTYVDLSNKPDWFLEISPLGRTPVLRVGNTSIFESAVILEYLEETRPNTLHPGDPLRRAEHRSWIEFGSTMLADIAGLYGAANRGAFEEKQARLEAKFSRLDNRLADDAWFDGPAFSLVDATFGPVFRYYDVFEDLGVSAVPSDLPKLAAWRASLSERPSVRAAVTDDYASLLKAFLIKKDSHLGACARKAVRRVP